MKLSIDILKSLVENGKIDHRGKNITGRCPYCGGNEWGISISDNHPFGCYRRVACGETGNIFKLLKKIGRLDLLENQEVVVELGMLLSEGLDQVESIGVPNLPEIDKPLGYRRADRLPYLDARGFTAADYEYYEIGVTKLEAKFADRAIFLIRQRQKLVGYVTRLMADKVAHKRMEAKLGKTIPRYINSASDFESILLGIDECTENTDTVILVEGLFGKRNVDKVFQLREQEEMKCLVTFGAKISPHQLMLLHMAGIQNIVLFYDPDVVPYIKKYATKLADEFERVRVAMIQEADKDPADLTAMEIGEIFDNLQDVLNFQLNTVQLFNLK